MIKYKADELQLHRDVLNRNGSTIVTKHNVQLGSDSSTSASRNSSYFNESNDCLKDLLDDAVICKLEDSDVLLKIMEDNGVIVTNNYGVKFPRSSNKLAPVPNNEKFALEVIFDGDGQPKFALPQLEKGRTSSIDPNKVVKNRSLPVLTSIKGDSKEQLVLKQAVGCTSTVAKHDWPSDEDDFDVPSTQELMRNAVSFGVVPPQIRREPPTVVEQTVGCKNTLAKREDEFAVSSTEELITSVIPVGVVPKIKQERSALVKQERSAVVKQERSAVVKQEIQDQCWTHKIKANNRHRSKWIDSTVFYTMSDEIFNYIFDKKAEQIDKTKFLYRKDSIGRELDLLFPGCVIYVDTYYEGTKKQFWRLQAYCSHLQCRNYRLIAQYHNPTVFQVFFDAQEVCHTQTIARQVRRYERDQEKSKLKNKMPTSLRVKSINETEDQFIENGNYKDIVSIDVMHKIRSEAMSEQDIESDDVNDVEAMQTKDEATNFISKVFGRCNFAVYIHAKNQHMVLHKLHVKRAKDGIPIVGRADATGNIARPIEGVIGQLLYYAMTINLTILHDKKSTALPLTEQFNVRHTSKDISLWLCDFILAHHSFYENPPLLLDFMISDFSYANFHALLFAFNKQTLQQYLTICYKWIMYKIENGEFPDEFNELLKIIMCYTHIMHTFGDMTKRHFGKTESNGQVEESRVVLEILAAIIKANEYSVILKLFQQLVILLSNEYTNSEVENATVELKRITTPLEADLDLDSEDNLHTPIDLDELPENCPTLYKNNPFYLEFQKIVDNTENFFEEGQEKNKFYNPGCLQKFMTRFVPLIPLWSSLLKIDKLEPIDSELLLLQGRHNQPIETYFGMFKRLLFQQAVTLGAPPIKMGRAITLSRSITNSTVKSIQLVIPKTRLNTQNPRKPYQKKSSKNDLDSVSGANETNFTSVDGAGQIEQVHVDATNQIDSIPLDGAGQIESIHVDATSQIKSIALDGTAKTVSIPLDSARTTFGSAKEQFKKKQKSKFSYFQMRTVSKMSAAIISKKTPQQKEDKHQHVATESTKLKTYPTNGLFMDSNIYSNLQDIQVIVASKAGTMLDNKTFATLNPSTPVSSELMSYVIMTLPKRIQVEFEKTKNILHNRLAPSFNKNIVFLILFEKYHFILFIINIIDAKKKSFAMLDPKPNRNLPKKRVDYFTNFMSCIRKNNEKWSTYEWKQVYYEIDVMSKDDNCNSGIYVIQYMFEYLKHSTVRKSNVSTETLRQTLKDKIIKESDNMKETCLQCGTEADGDWGSCTVCDRWTHAKCQGIDIDVIKKQNDYKCIICSQL